ncbi:hypothetical protein BV22DRAFT_754317 [Leucogyrophana mollusca]|uniref:Uncharacterized protein n=1 Tax=Leucogyrophana mollusca TaxID=85980 RepID=A0ACB8B893_9AGAM|nr:hypothetical protein BV22DRAFT_754317 [Leucogyrophana mollusca]
MLMSRFVAYKHAGILHRDVSVGDIALRADAARGPPIDRDLYKPLDTASRRVGRLPRIGTWQFMAAASLRNSQKPHELQDDLEFFLHVLTWTAIQRCPSTLSASERSIYLRLTFEQTIETTHGVAGGLHKRLVLAAGRYLPECPGGEDFQFSASSPLLGLLEAFSGGFAARYQIPPTAAAREKFERQKVQALADNNTMWLEYLADHPVEAYDRAQRALSTSDWVLSTLRAYAEGEHGAWATDDATQR